MFPNCPGEKIHERMDSIFMEVREVSILLLVIFSQALLFNSWTEPAVPRAAWLCGALGGVQVPFVHLENCSPPQQEQLTGFRRCE